MKVTQWKQNKMKLHSSGKNRFVNKEDNCSDQTEKKCQGKQKRTKSNTKINDFSTLLLCSY